MVHWENPITGCAGYLLKLTASLLGPHVLTLGHLNVIPLQPMANYKLKEEKLIYIITNQKEWLHTLVSFITGDINYSWTPPLTLAQNSIPVGMYESYIQPRPISRPAWRFFPSQQTKTEFLFKTGIQLMSDVFV